MFRLILVFSLLLYAGSSAAFAVLDLSEPGPYAVGSDQVTDTRPNGSTITTLLFYPATRSGANAPIDSSGAPYPAISFGHGFVQAPSNYQSTLVHLASHGYFVVASESFTGLFPNHAAFAADLSHCLTWLEVQHETPGSMFEGLLDVNNYGMSGHSMGGGASILATADDPRVRALANLAANETSTSAIEAMNKVSVPVSLIAGSDDSITPVQSNGALMYANADPPRQLPIQQGAFHCGYLDFSIPFVCDSGAMSRETQLALTRRDLTAFFNLYLKGDQSVWHMVWGPEAFDDPLIDRTADAGFTISVDADESLSIAEGSTSVLTVIVSNETFVSSMFTVFLDDTDGLVSADPVTTGPLSAGDHVAIELVVDAAVDSSGQIAQPLISARAEHDGGTRAWSMPNIAITDAPVTPGDLNGNGSVGVSDLLILLGQWGACPECSDCPPDLTGDCSVGVGDLLILLGNWG